jgi:hypothetical protein
MKRWFSIVFLVGMVAFSACNRPIEMRHGTSLPTDVSPELSAIDSSLPTGTYTLRVAMEDGQVFSDKVVKE